MDVFNILKIGQGFNKRYAVTYRQSILYLAICVYENQAIQLRDTLNVLSKFENLERLTHTKVRQKAFKILQSIKVQE